MLPGARIARDFINCNQSDLLPGYRIEIIESNHEACGLAQAIQETYINLARFALQRECGPVVAVAGLACSSSTAISAPLAGHVGTDLIQLASSGSPAFDRDIERNFSTYPRLWRYVSSAAIYVDAFLTLLTRFSWRNVGLVQDLDSFYYINIASTLKRELASRRSEFQLISSSGLEKTDPQFINKAVQNIKDTGVRIIFAATNYVQSALLICRAAEEGLIYPRYQWVFMNMYIQDFVEHQTCNVSMLYKGLNSSFLLQYELESAKLDVVKVTGGEIHGFFNMYQQHFRDIQKDFNVTGNLELLSGIDYGYILFDQIWSFAHTLNHTLPLLKSKNLSLSNYAARSGIIANIIEEQLSKLNIRGVSSNIRFNHIRVVPSILRIVYPVLLNETAITGILVGMYTNTSLLYLNLTKSDVPPDHADQHLIPLHVAAIILMYIAVFVAFVLVTIILVLFLLYRKKPEIKAAGPCLSLFIFAGCYLLCLGSLFQITYESFGGTKITGITYEFLCGTQLFVEQNGYSLILVTLFIKMLQIHHIFSTQKKLSSVWKNSSLAIIVITLCLVPNISSIIINFTLKPDYKSSVIPLTATKDENSVHHEHAIVSCNQHNNIWYIVSYLPLGLYLFMITYLAIITRNIKKKDFKDTKKVNLFVATVVVLIVVYIFTWWILLETQQKQYVAVIHTLYPLVVASACQLILFAPKILPTCCSEQEIPSLSSAYTFSISNANNLH